ncbi:hypothetical protein TRIUR3_10394 [Triticum urartu]|uniref:Uncharacterized protein n=1 Tax=Triticum urartu TaxID=4572 RepID=M7YWW2_TRIUA|nr:hypothetical protein TRIUR3_10394 [Triticum urartu]
MGFNHCKSSNVSVCLCTCWTSRAAGAAPTAGVERVLVSSGERRREEKEDAKYLRMERRMGKLMRKFVLPENADMEKISAACRDGVLTVTVDKLPPPEPKKPKTIQVQVA